MRGESEPLWRHVYNAERLIELRKYSAALDELEHALSYSSRETSIFRLYASCLLQLKRPLDALKAIEQALELDADSPENHHSYGVVAQELRRFGEAETAFRKAIERAPFVSAYYSNYARLLCVRGDYAEAVAQAQEAVRLNPGMAHAFEILSWAEMELCRWEDARLHCLDSLRLDPESAWAHNNMGVWFMAQGEAKQAHTEFVEALRLRPDLKIAQENVIKSLQASHPLFATSWKLTNLLLRVPIRWRNLVVYTILAVIWFIGLAAGQMIGGDWGVWIGFVIWIVLLVSLLFLLLGHELFVMLVRKGWIR